MAAQSDNKSHFYTTVNLYEWWLIWAENENREKKLAIAGHTSQVQRAVRVFSSSPILRRHDVFTLETTDGIYVRILGLINKTQTEENGFPSEVFKCFFFGFPPNWEVCAEHYLAQGFASNDVSREDSNLKGLTQTIEECNATNVGANVSPVSADPKLDKDPALCQITEGSQTVMYINETGGEKDPGWKKTADIEMENKLKENADITEASEAEKKAHNSVSSEDANLKGCSNANEAVRNITRARGAKDTNQRKTAAFEKESIMEENTASKKASTAGKKTCTDPTRRFRGISKKSDKADRCRTRSGGAKNTDRKRTTAVKSKSTLVEKAASKETSTLEKNTKRKLTYVGSPVTPKADVITSFTSPGLSSVKRSRSGRLLLPTLEYWRNQTVVYDPNHQVIIGVTDGISTPSRAELTHEPKRSEGRPRSNKDPNAATKKLPHEPKTSVGRPKSIKDPDAAKATKKLTKEPKRSVERPKSIKVSGAAKEIKSSRRR